MINKLSKIADNVGPMNVELSCFKIHGNRFDCCRCYNNQYLQLNNSELNIVSTET